MLYWFNDDSTNAINNARTFHNIYKLQRHVLLRHQSYLIVFTGNNNFQFGRECHFNIDTLFVVPILWVNFLELIALNIDFSVTTRNHLHHRNKGTSYWEEEHFQQYFSYIVAVSFSGGGNRSTWRKPPTFRKSITNLSHNVARVHLAWTGFELKKLVSGDMYSLYR